MFIYIYIHIYTYMYICICIYILYIYKVVRETEPGNAIPTFVISPPALLLVITRAGYPGNAI